VQAALRAGAAVALAGQVGLWLAPSLGLLWATFIGGGTGVIFVLGLAAPAELAPRELVGATSGVFNTLAYVAAFLGALLVGALRDLTGGFQWAWIALTALAVVLLGSAWRVPELRRRG
jgi:CP family cyanate transporter-like MFS transporter